LCRRRVVGLERRNRAPGDTRGDGGVGDRVRDDGELIDADRNAGPVPRDV
jgi:hypothetical protein